MTARAVTRAGVWLDLPLVVAGLALSLAAGCVPTLDERPWLVTAPQIVGWTAEPPETRPGGDVTLRVIAMDPSGSPAGPVDATGAAWTLCHTPKPPDENRVVTPDCLAPGGAADALGDPVSMKMPADACRLFGPDVPQPLPGAPTTRPRDPDASGGYYQPVTIALGAARAVGLERITCDLPDASLADARAFQTAYHANQNPTISSLRFTLDGDATGNPVDLAAVPRGAHLSVDAIFPAEAIETFPLFDRQARAVVPAQETLGASWYVTGGTLDRPTTEIAGATAAAAATAITTGWIAPDQAATLEIVLVLRDSRGGSAAARATLVVTGD